MTHYGGRVVRRSGVPPCYEKTDAHCGHSCLCSAHSEEQLQRRAGDRAGKSLVLIICLVCRFQINIHREQETLTEKVLWIF